MNKLISLIMLVVACVSCQTNSAQSTNNLDVKAYKEQINSKSNIQLVDVRTAAEYQGGHLANAVNIDFNGPDFEQKIKKLDKTKPVYVYCLSGGRSSNAVAIMSKNGFKEVYNMKGGILEWKANSFPLTGQAVATSGNSWIGMTKAEYDKYTQSEIPVLFDFKAKWCGPCKQLAPILHDLEKEFTGKLKVVEIDVDENKSLADELKISSIPFLIFYKNGKHAMNIDGLTDRKNLIRSLGLKK